jgi:hypothetical protein
MANVIVRQSTSVRIVYMHIYIYSIGYIVRPHLFIWVTPFGSMNTQIDSNIVVEQDNDVINCITI